MLISFILIITVLIVLLYLERKKVREVQSEIREIQNSFAKERIKIAALAKKRSGAVQWGLAIENFVPFMDKFPIPAENAHHFGKPVDFIGFTDMDDPEKCALHVIEVKSGTAFLNTHQKNIKKAIKAKRVEWHEVRVHANSVK